MDDKPTTADLAPPTAEEVLPIPGQATAAGWVLRAMALASLIAIFLLLLRYDLELLQWRLRIMPRDLHGVTKQIWEGFRNFGQVLAVVVAIVIVFRLDRRRKWIIVGILTAQFLAAVGYNSGKFSIARYRPAAALSELPANFTIDQTWLGWDPDVERMEKYKSFPSGHSGGAFAFAGILVWFYPRLKITFWTLAVGCAASRWVDLMHWPSDCFFGAVIGYFGAWLALHPYVWWLPVIWYRRRLKRLRQE